MATTLKPFYRFLGKTGIQVSPLGLGTVKFGRKDKVKYPAPFDLPDEAALAALLADAQALGINLIDTAPAYGLAEERLGRLLAGHRADWIIAGKAGENFSDSVSHYDFTPDAIRRSVEVSLHNLQTDYLDILLLHGTQGDEALCYDDPLLKTLADMKSSGVIRAAGLSTHSTAAGLIGAKIFDVLMVAYNLNWRTEDTVIEAAAQNNCGILLKKVFNSGHDVHEKGNDPVSNTFRFIFDKPAVNSAIVGTINAEHLKDNVEKLAIILTNK